MEKIKRIVVPLLLCVSLLLYVAGCGGAPETSGAKSAGNDKVIKWDYIDIIAQDHPAAKIMLDFAEEIKEKTNGRLIITFRAPGELPIKTDEYVRAVGENSVQMANGLLSTISGDLVAGGIPVLPFIVNDDKELKVVMDILKDDYKKELAQYGCDTLFYYSWPFQNLWGQGEPVTDMKQLKGQKFRVQGIEQSIFCDKNAIVPVSMGAAEVLTSLSRSVINGVVTAGVNVYGSKYYDALKWGYLTDIQTTTTIILVNKKALADLPDDIRKIVLETSEKYSPIGQRFLLDVEDDLQKQLVEKHGMVINKASQEEKDAQMGWAKEYWMQWAQKKGGTAPERLEQVVKTLGK